MIRPPVLLTALVALVVPGAAAAQSLGTFRWQLQPYCNVIVVSVIQNGSIYRLEGTDDQCGGANAPASVIGTAFLNPDGTVGMGLNIVSAPEGVPTPIAATLSLATLSGTWRDGAGRTGAFAFTPGAGTGGSPRPLPTPAVPSAVVLSPTGSVVASGAVGVGSAPASGAGVRMMWCAGKAAFRAGEVGADEWDDANIGRGSAALGYCWTRASGGLSTAMGAGTTASGDLSTAMGTGTTARGWGSVAMGGDTTASGGLSTAMGRNTTASGDFSTAMGFYATASGDYGTAMGLSTTASGLVSTAMGSQTVASGHDSTAMGTRSEARGRSSLAMGIASIAVGVSSVALGTGAVAQQGGSFVFADGSGAGQLFALGANEFTVRAAGGVAFFSNATASLGVRLAPGATQWSSLSDVRSKHLFRDLDGEDILTRVARMAVTEWSYQAQDPSIRHIGPTAQDFRAAFGLGEDPLRIGTLDADGVALAAVKALEARTRRLQAEFDVRTQALRDENTRLREALADWRREFDGLKVRQQP